MKVSEERFDINGRNKNTEYTGIKKEMRKFCISEGFSERIFNSLTYLVNRKMQTIESVKKIIGTYKSVFESLGYGPEDVIAFLNENPGLIEVKENYFKYNVALLNCMGREIMESALFDGTNILSVKTNPIELNAVIRWMTETNDSGEKRETSVYEIKYYLDNLDRESMGELIKKHPFTAKIGSGVLFKSEILTNARIKENQKWVKGLK